jgi:hypothetical protein
MPSLASAWTKSDLINWIATQREYRSYLELCTVTTGLRYKEIDRTRLAVCHRLMYRCPSGYADELPIDFRSVGLDISSCVRVIRERGYRYDLILVDPLHEYGASMRDLTEALGLLTDRGTIVVHDCLPPTAELAGPNFRVGDRCGLTHRAYLDFVFARANLEYRTVDIDYGCGVIRARSGLARVRGWWGMSRKRRALIAQWHALGHDSNKSCSFLQSQRHGYPICVRSMISSQKKGAAIAPQDWRHSARSAKTDFHSRC